MSAKTMMISINENLDQIGVGQCRGMNGALQCAGGRRKRPPEFGRPSMLRLQRSIVPAFPVRGFVAARPATIASRAPPVAIASLAADAAIPIVPIVTIVAVMAVTAFAI